MALYINTGMMGPTEEEGIQTALGGVSGAASGAMIGSQIGAIGGLPGMLGGAAIGAGLAYLQSSKATKTRKAAIKDTAAARRQSAMQEQGARQQAENIAMGGLVRNRGANNVLSSQGFIGQNLPTNAGTF